MLAEAKGRKDRAIDSARKVAATRRAAIYQAHRRRTWADWLKQQAQAGDGQALDALRAREAAQGLKGNATRFKGAWSLTLAMVTAFIHDCSHGQQMIGFESWRS